MSVEHKLLLQLFLIGLCLVCSKTGKKISMEFHLISRYCLDYQCNFHTLPANPQQTSLKTGIFLRVLANLFSNPEYH